MYNLLVSGRTDTWDGEPWLIEIGRCVHASEYTQGDIVEKYGALTEEQIEEICKLPSIFAYEQRQEENPHFGFVRGLTKRLRAILDHVPPIFDKEKFKEVASECGTKSFQGTMKYLQDGARKIADAHLHSPVRKKETLPTDLQVNFIPYIDVLLAEIVTVMESEKH